MPSGKTLWMPVIGLMVLAAAACGSRDRATGPVDGRPPNFVVILSDDLGYGDIGPFGSTVHRTPNLDRMADQGMVFTSFYVTSGLCTPSRASLMTGAYPRRVGLHESETDKLTLFPGSRRGLDPSETTIAEVLQRRGYATAIIGKWHLGDQPDFLPRRHGFDEYFGLPYSNDMGREGFEWRRSRASSDGEPEPGYYPLPLLRDEQVIETEPDQGLLTRRYTEEAVRFIAGNRDRPFFLYLPHTMPHQPVHASEAFLGRSAGGLYGDTVEELDWSTGQILDALARNGIDHETLVIFTSDNGANVFGGSNAPLRGFKGSTWEGGMRVPYLMRWPGRIPAGTGCDELVTIMDLLPTLARLAGEPLDPERTIDGEDIWPLMSGQPGAASPHDRLYYYFRGTLEAVRSGRWKLHFEHVRDRTDEQMERIELYDLADDIGETTNVASSYPDVVERLLALAEQARQDLGDDRTGHAGANTRSPGFVASSTPLTPFSRP